jgi:hypothetical protein
MRITGGEVGVERIDAVSCLVCCMDNKSSLKCEFEKRFAGVHIVNKVAMTIATLIIVCTAFIKLYGFADVSAVAVLEEDWGGEVG